MNESEREGMNESEREGMNESESEGGEKGRTHRFGDIKTCVLGNELTLGRQKIFSD